MPTKAQFSRPKAPRILFMRRTTYPIILIKLPESLTRCSRVLYKLKNFSVLPTILYPVVHARIQKNLLHFPVLLQVNPIHAFQFYIFKTHAILSSQLNLGLPSGLFPSSYALPPPRLSPCNTNILRGKFNK